MPSISVLLPVYNSAPYLRECLDSILRQTYRDFEFLILNDGSTDESDAIIRSYDDPRIIYIPYTDNTGYVHRLNEGIQLSRGKYLARMDADDIALPDRFRLQNEAMEARPEVVVCGGVVERFGTLNGIERFDRDFLCGLLTSPFCHPATMIRKSYLLDHHLQYEEACAYYEDFKLWNEIYAAHQYDSRCFYTVPEPVLRYRTHPSQVSSIFKQHQIMGGILERRVFLKKLFSHFDTPFSLTSLPLQKTELHQVERDLDALMEKPAFIQSFPLKARLQFSGMFRLYMYLSYPQKDAGLFFRFAAQYLQQKGITLQAVIKVKLHLLFGRSYRVKF